MKKSVFDIRRTIEVTGLGKITASQATLNTISIALSEAAHKYYSEGCNALADAAQEQSDQIYAELKKHGLYD